MKGLGWDDPRLRRLSWELNDQQPIVFFLPHYDKRTVAAFDMHFSIELGVVTSGRMRRYYHSWECDLRPGQVWLCGIWEPHGYKVLEVPCEATVLAIWPDMLANLHFEEALDYRWLAPFTASPESRPQVPAAQWDRVLKYAREIKEEISDTGDRAKIRLRLSLLEILLILTEGWDPQKISESAVKTPFRTVKQAMELVFGTKRPVTVERAAKVCGMSRNPFSRLFRQVTGISFPKFAMRHRLSGAAHDLAHTRMAVKAIAEDWGFVDYSHLHRCFRENYGCSPKEYRKNTAGSNSFVR